MTYIDSQLDFQGENVRGREGRGGTKEGTDEGRTRGEKRGGRGYGERRKMGIREGELKEWRDIWVREDKKGV